MISKIRFLFLLIALLLYGGGALWGQDDFNPSSPSEPGAPPTKVVLRVEPANGGSVTGGGKYVPEESVSLNAYANEGFRFVNWTDSEGKVVSTSRDYVFVKGNTKEEFTAHFAFDPGSPAEPVPSELLVYYHLSIVAGEGGTVSGGGHYQAGKSVSLYASCNENFEFVNWTDEDGEVVSTENSFYYTTVSKNETLTANFRFNPTDPSEPSNPKLRHRIYLTSTEGGTVYTSDHVVYEGGSASISAYPNEGYDFVGWYLDDVLYTTLSSFSYTMGDKDVEFEARFEFNPKDPSEPSKPSEKQYALYLMNEVTYPGTKIDYPLYLTSLDDLGDMTFQMTFAEGLVPDWQTLKLGDGVEGYTPSVTKGSEAGVYIVTLIGGKVKAGNKVLLTLKVSVPETVPLGSVNTVKLNQVSVTQMDGISVTASTRNGSVQVYELGDTNADNKVDSTDYMNSIMKRLGTKIKRFFDNLSDVNGDGVVDFSDALEIMYKILGKRIK